jgi:hypothetical protein
VAGNPRIVESSIVVNSTFDTVTFNVENKGDPYLTSAFVLLAQEPSDNEGDKGMFALGAFGNLNGFALGQAENNFFRGGLFNDVPTQAAHTLTVTAINGTDYDKVTTFRFSSQTPLNAGATKVLLHIANAVEGSSSVVATVTAIPSRVIIPDTVQLNGNGVLNFITYNTSPPHGLNVGDRIVYSGATGALASLHGTYTIVFANSSGYSVNSSIFGQTIWSDYQPAGYNIGVVTVAN